MAVVPHLIYMFEFVIDDLVITLQNYCAPDEYPICVEISFRNCVYVIVCDRDSGNCVDPCRPKTGKRCLFPLTSPVTEEDRLHIHVYKRRSNCCKFLLGLSEISIHTLFKRVDKAFEAQNDGWLQRWMDQLADLPRMKDPASNVMDRCDCFDSSYERREQLCPVSSVIKQLVPIFNLCSRQTGNIVLIIRLACHGPTITSVYFRREDGKTEAMASSKQPQICPSSEAEEPRKCHRSFACNRDKQCPCNICVDECGRKCPKAKQKKSKKHAKKHCPPKVEEETITM
ncbi:uncharacterized protein LOC132789839 [Drosophila nasuta]|uniref:uncharacterized protein LOC132789839 n=1 Tax=Drosophila nasuta TaxID=42062 RepID=UPI00295EE717|nr:uncharacterized protein LOC132789839 [Drosophila nasuta]